MIEKFLVSTVNKKEIDLRDEILLILSCRECFVKMEYYFLFIGNPKF